MNEENNETVDWNDESNLSMKERRGSFLQVLAILSWIWIGIQGFSTITSYMAGPELLETALVDVDEARGNSDNAFVESIFESSTIVLKNTIENFNAIQLSTFLMYLIGGLAVYMMFSLKKTGFFLYIVYCTGLAMVTMLYIGTSMAALLGISFDMFFSIAFIIMYGVNLKRMTA